MTQDTEKQLPRVGLLGTPGSVLFSELGFDGTMNQVGLNTGNLMFQYACTRNIINPVTHFQLGANLDLELLRNNIDVLVIPAANQLNPQWDLKWWAKLIEDLAKPVVIVGLGAQAKIDEVDAVQLQAGTVRFLHLLKEYANVIGVRGETTLKLMERYGVTNATVTGCPSNFINSQVSGDVIKRSLDAVLQKEKLRVNYLVGTLEEYARECERQIYTLVNMHDGKFIYQTNIKHLRYIINGVEDEALRKHLDWEAKTIAPDLSPSEYRRKMRHRGKFYFSAPAWIDDVARDDLSVGMRIHGTVAAVQGGTAGICVAFDARTLELARTMGYPYVMADNVGFFKSVKDLVRHVVFDANEFDKKRTELKRSLKRCLEQHGVISALESR